MNKSNEEKLATEIEKWFNDSNLIALHFWERNKVGKIIKNNLKSIGKWKYRARGNPRKGYEAFKNKQNDW